MMSAGQDFHRQVGNAGIAILHIGPLNQITVITTQQQGRSLNPRQVRQNLRLAQIQRRNEAQARIGAPAKTVANRLDPALHENRCGPP